MNAVRAGASPEFLRGAVPVLGAADLERLSAHHAEYTRLSRAASDQVALPHPQLEGDLQPPSAQVVNQIEKACEDLGVSSSRLVDLIATFKSLTSIDVANYKAYMLKTGKNSV